MLFTSKDKAVPSKISNYIIYKNNFNNIGSTSPFLNNFFSTLI